MAGPRRILKPICCFGCRKPGEMFGIGQHEEKGRVFVFKHDRQKWCFVPFAIDGAANTMVGLSRRRSRGVRS
jgi:hypothetical protein